MQSISIAKFADIRRKNANFSRNNGLHHVIYTFLFTFFW